MTHLIASSIIGTTATVLAISLLLLRAEVQGRRPVLALSQRWVELDARTSFVVVALLSAIAIFSFALMPALEQHTARAASAHDSAPADQDVEALRAYAGALSGNPQSGATVSSDPEPATLPAVDQMIAKLVARLEKQPGDVKGWKTLAWSYLNMDRPEEAARAYATALKLAPGDSEIQKGLEQAKLAETAATQSQPSGPTLEPATDAVKAAGAISEPQQNSMILSMVDGLATRLEQAPNDEEGWVRLMRSRMTLGDKEAAKAALTKALETFAREPAAKDRLSTAARELGIESN